MIRMALLAVVALPAVSPWVSAQDSMPSASMSAVDEAQRVKNWRADLDALATGLPAKHKDAFFKISKYEWKIAVDQLDERLPSLSDQMIALEFAKLVALIGDTHTQLQIDVNVQKYHVYPIIVRLFSDGVFVVAAWDERRDLLGAQILAIDGKPADDVVKRVGTLFASENESSLKNSVCNWMVLGEPLQSVGVSRSNERAEMSFRFADGSEKTLALEALAPGKRVPFVSMPDAKSPNLPISFQRKKESYWSEPLKDQNALYIRYDRCNDDPGKSVKQFAEETLKYIDDNKPGKVIIDLRRNSGGNSALLHPLISGLAGNVAINRKGRLFVLVGRTTFSSAMMNAQEFRDQTRAILVGEPTGGKPNHFGEIKFFELPNSRIKVQYSTNQFKMVEGDPPSVMPDVTVDLSSKEFFAARDTVLDSVLVAPSGDSD